MIYVAMFIYIHIFIHIFDILYTHTKKNRLREFNCARFRYSLLPADGFGTGGQHRIVGNHILFLLGKKKRCFKKNTPRKTNGWNISSWRFGSDHFPFFSWVMAVGSMLNFQGVTLKKTWRCWVGDEFGKLMKFVERRWSDCGNDVNDMISWRYELEVGVEKVGCMLCKLLTVSSLCSTWFLRWLWKFGDRKHVLLKMLNPLIWRRWSFPRNCQTWETCKTQRQISVIFMFTPTC